MKTFINPIRNPVVSTGAIALLDTLPLADLVQAIVTGNIRLLEQAPKVGKKTAERIALELKTTLAEWRQEAGFAATEIPGILPAIQEDVEISLLALDFTPAEVMAAIAAISQDSTIATSQDAEVWIKGAIAWLSQQQ